MREILLAGDHSCDVDEDEKEHITIVHVYNLAV